MEIIRQLEEEEVEEEVAAEGDRGGYSGLLSEKLTSRLAHVPRPGRLRGDGWSFREKKGFETYNCEKTNYSLARFAAFIQLP